MIDGKIRSTADATEKKDTMRNECERGAFPVATSRVIPLLREEYSGRVEDDPKAKAIVAVPDIRSGFLKK